MEDPHTKQRWSEALEIAEEAFGVEASERAALVARRCGDDEALRREVEILLRADERADAFLADAPGARLRSLEGPAPEEMPERVGPYRLLRRLGEGGMGEVFEAEQTEPVFRRVALKLIKRGMDSREVVARFESERQTLALMRHSYIAQFYDVGTSAEGRPYVVLELVPGLPITRYCDQHRLSIPERLELVLAVCEGVQHAHQKGVIHRDLKPSNLLVTVEGERAVPKIIDFGVAKAMHTLGVPGSPRTLWGQMVGTPEYMSPEQAELGGLDVDTRSDVYALGVVLYELLTGVLPLDTDDSSGAGLEEIRQWIRDKDPPSPSLRLSRLGERAEEISRVRGRDPASLGRLLRGDLDWIVAKALDKDRTRRYASPAELAADLRRFLAQEPVLARPPSLGYQLSRLVRRHRRWVAAGALALAGLVAGVVGLTVGAIRAQQEAESARQVATALEEILGGLDPSQPSGRAQTPSHLLARSAERIGEQLQEQPLVRARLLSTVGRVSRNLAFYEQARPALEQALSLRRKYLGEDHEEVASALHDLGWLEFQEGDYGAARRAFEAALRIHEQRFGPDHPKVAWSLDDLSVVLWKSGEYRAALPLAERALEIFRTLGEEDPRVARGLYHRGIVLTGLEERQEAWSSLRQALELYTRRLGPEHPLVGWVLVDLGLLVRRRQGAEPSRGYFERALAIQEKHFGPEHPDVGFPLFFLGHVERETGSPEVARQIFERLLALRERSLGAEHPEIAGPLVGLGLLARDEGDVERARQLLERALVLREGALGPEHPDLVWVLRPLGGVALDRGDYETAKSLFTRALRIVERNLGPGHWRTVPWRNNVGIVRAKLGDGEAAREIFARGLALAEAQGPEAAAVLNASLYNLACIAAGDGERAQALAYLRRAVDNGHTSSLYFDDPDLDPLRGDPELEGLIDRVRAARAAAPAQNR